MAQLCPTCGGLGELAQAPARVWRIGGKPIEPKMGLLLAALLARPGRLVTHQAMAVLLWNGAEPDSAMDCIKVWISRLRRLLKSAGLPAAAASGGIENVHGQGYRLALNADALAGLSLEMDPYPAPDAAPDTARDTEAAA
jgi:DNA-binding winged helix-turn-helix (wHTH) protein